MSKNNTSVASNFLWKFAERISAQLVTLVVSVVLARLLEPSHYGIISMVMVFITIANVFVSDGFGSALIQKKDADRLDFSSVLVANLSLSVILYFVLFFTAPFIEKFFGNNYQLLTPVIRVLSLRLILSAVNSVQQAYVSRKMIFKKFFWATLSGTVISAVVGIAMAYKGLGVWALVAQYLTNTTIDTIILQLSLKKWPGFKISFDRLKSLFSFGWKILGASLLNNGYQELRTLLIGKFYTSADLAYYSKGNQFPSIVVININTSIGSVLFPKLSTMQDDIQLMKNSVRKSIRLSAYLLTPMMFGLAAISTPFIRFLLTDKWLLAVPFLQLFCIYYLAQPIHTANIQAIKALGRSDILLKLEIIKKVIELTALVISLTISVTAVAVVAVILNYLFIFINAYPNKKLMGYTTKEQLSDLIPILLLGVIMGGVVIMLGRLPLADLPLMAIQIVAGIVVYLMLSIITGKKEFYILFDFVKSFLKSHIH